MRAVVVYESMYGNTRVVAEAIAEGLARTCDVDVRPVADTEADVVRDVDLLVVGGPTHVHAMSRPSTRHSAAHDIERKGRGDLVLEPGAEGTGLREWFDGLGQGSALAAAFDTRIDVSAVVSGRASRGIARLLRRHGMALVVPPESFMVSKTSHLLPGERKRAVDWGLLVGDAAVISGPVAAG